MRRLVRRSIPLVVGLSLLLAPIAAAIEADATWPREVNTEMGVLAVAQPQPEKFENHIPGGRAAVSLVPKGKTPAVFGVFWFTGRVDTARDS